VHSFLCYDSAAADHDRLAVPAIFAEPARDLVARTGLPAAGRILDIGTGTGIAARLAIELAHPGTIVVGLDPSLEMLRVARSHDLLCLAVGAVPGLPYPDAAFDRILANFVLSHLTSYRTALLDIVRVLRPG
jgi:ubiquinone/menaquinone biosynthesis C-methylase UbiE